MKKLNVLFILLACVSCTLQSELEQHPEKRNQHWVYLENEDTGEAQWLKIDADGNAELNGWVTTFYCNGNIRSEGRYLEGDPIDTISYFRLNGGMLFRWCQDEDGNETELLEDGVFESFRADCTLGLLGMVEKGKFVGNTVFFDENGDTIEVQEHYGDTISYTYYYPNGKVLQTNRTVAGLPDGDYFEYHENGSIALKGREYQGLMQGTWSQYYENGQLESRKSFHDDLLEDTSLKYHENGKLASLASYENGLLTGERKNWYASGQLEASVTYVNDIREGPFVQYFENGNLDKVGQFKNDKQDGNWVYYDENGTKRAEGEFSMGEQTGRWYMYDDQGEKEIERQF